MDKYQNKYRIASARAPFWDYGWNATYFVTICTENRVCWFGEISDGAMNLSDMGKIVESEWLKTFDIRPDMNLWRGEFVVMPNHFHGIIGIGENQYNIPSVETRCIASLPPKNQFGPQSKNLASIIRGFKSSVTINARKIDPDFQWQARFHDHIIRDDTSFQNISNYIVNNPPNWREDEFYNSGK